MGERRQFCWSRRKVSWIGAGVLLVAAFGVPMIVLGDDGAKALGAAWIVVFLGLLAVLLRRSRSTEPVIVIDERGLLDRRAFEAPIPWSEIRSVERLVVEHMTVVAIDISDGALSKARRMIRWMKWPHKLVRMPVFSISMHPLDGSVDELIAAIESWRLQ
ncbi:MAG: STM3941 family protein [Hyphomicrobium sp.]